MKNYNFPEMTEKIIRRDRRAWGPEREAYGSVTASDNMRRGGNEFEFKILMPWRQVALSRWWGREKRGKQLNMNAVLSVRYNNSLLFSSSSGVITAICSEIIVIKYDNLIRAFCILWVNPNICFFPLQAAYTSILQTENGNFIHGTKSEPSILNAHLVIL